MGIFDFFPANFFPGALESLQSGVIGEFPTPKFLHLVPVPGSWRYIDLLYVNGFRIEHIYTLYIVLPTYLVCKTHIKRRYKNAKPLRHPAMITSSVTRPFHCAPPLFLLLNLLPPQLHIPQKWLREYTQCQSISKSNPTKTATSPSTPAP
jgi:hypothetical protein